MTREFGSLERLKVPDAMSLDVVIRTMQDAAGFVIPLNDSFRADPEALLAHRLGEGNVHQQPAKPCVSSRSVTSATQLRHAKIATLVGVTR